MVADKSMLLILKRWIKGPWLVHDIIHDIYQESLIEMKRTYQYL